MHGIDDINDAEKFRSVVITADRDQLPPLPEGTFYISDIIGLNVYDNDKYIGVIYDWIETGRNNVYVIKREKGKNAQFTFSVLS